MIRSKTGVQEWASASLNIDRGCVNRCCYGYCSANARRFHRLPEFGWEHPEPLPALTVETALRKLERAKLPQTVMFPTMHDITHQNVGRASEACLRVLAAPAGHRLLIVSKPRIGCISQLMYDLTNWKGRVEFRCTIGANHSHVLKVVEPGAPTLDERWWTVRQIAMYGWNVSVSMEPLLLTDHGSVECMVRRLADFARCVWIGTMNRAASCLALNRAPPEARGLALDIVRVQSNPRWWAELRDALKGLPDGFVQWKDGARKMLDEWDGIRRELPGGMSK